MIFRRYTKFYGTDGDAAATLAHDAILGIIHFLTMTLLNALLSYFIVRHTPILQ